jgi:hypothetical protein
LPLPEGPDTWTISFRWSFSLRKVDEQFTPEENVRVFFLERQQTSVRAGRNVASHIRGRQRNGTFRGLAGGRRDALTGRDTQCRSHFRNRGAVCGFSPFKVLDCPGRNYRFLRQLLLTPTPATPQFQYDLRSGLNEITDLCFGILREIASQMRLRFVLNTGNEMSNRDVTIFWNAPRKEFEEALPGSEIREVNYRAEGTMVFLRRIRHLQRISRKCSERHSAEVSGFNRESQEDFQGR